MATDDRLRALDRLVGEWQTTITLRNPDGSPGAVSTASDIYRWSANGKFLQHDVDAQIDGRRLLSVEMIALDPSGSGYTTRSYDPDGSFSDFTAELDGPNWSLTGARQRFRGAFSADGRSLSGEWEQKAGAGWEPLMQVTLKKL